MEEPPNDATAAQRQRRGRCFEEFALGDTFITDARTVTEADVVAYAGLSGDFAPMHVDAEYSRRSVFGARVAHGFLGRVMLSGLVARSGIFHRTSLANLGLEDWNFTAPIFIGDTIHGCLKVIGLRPTSDGCRGVITLGITVHNQKDAIVQRGRQKLMVARLRFLP